MVDPAMTMSRPTTMFVAPGAAAHVAPPAVSPTPSPASAPRVPLADGSAMACMPSIGTNVPARKPSGKARALPKPNMASGLRTSMPSSTPNQLKREQS